MKDFWNERYSAEEYAYGEEPNEYFAEKLSELDCGKILLPADGEGRNGVFAAKLGWSVTSFDISESGKEKAEKLAQKNNVAIKYDIADVETFTNLKIGDEGRGTRDEENRQIAESHKSIQPKEESFDVIALIFAHFHEDKRKIYHQRLDKLLKPGGYIIMEAFSKNHTHYNRLNEQVGGPKDEKMLYDLSDIKQEFPNYSLIELKEAELLLNEGAYHKGKG
ncbi:MAG: SAM-dependent methyltransferase, partial [bacterium]